MHESLLTIHEAAEKLNVHWQTIRNYIRDGKLPATKFGRNVRISEKDLEIFALGEAQEEVEPQAEEEILPSKETRMLLILNPKEFRNQLLTQGFEIIEATQQEEVWFAPEFIKNTQEWKAWINNEEGPLVNVAKTKDQSILCIRTKKQPPQHIRISHGDLPSALTLLSLKQCAKITVKIEHYQKHADLIKLETIADVGSAATITSANKQHLFTICNQLAVDDAPMLSAPFDLIAAQSHATF